MDCVSWGLLFFIAPLGVLFTGPLDDRPQRRGGSGDYYVVLLFRPELGAWEPVVIDDFFPADVCTGAHLCAHRACFCYLIVPGGAVFCKFILRIPPYSQRRFAPFLAAVRARKLGGLFVSFFFKFFAYCYIS